MGYLSRGHECALPRNPKPLRDAVWECAGTAACCGRLYVYDANRLSLNDPELSWRLAYPAEGRLFYPERYPEPIPSAMPSSPESVPEHFRLPGPTTTLIVLTVMVVCAVVSYFVMVGW